jgi:F420-dependent oxidoreductase-like protein
MFRSDHYMNLDGLDPSRVSLDAWATINALAAVTSTLRLGTMVSPTSFRHPSVLAKMVASADQVSGGRIDLGLGAGWHEGEHSAYGFPFLPVKERVDVLEEQLQIVLGGWAEGPFSFDGDHYTLKDLDAQPKPVQRPHPPLIMGGNAAARSARLAARYADEYNTPFPTIADVKERKRRIDDACEHAGREPIPFSVMTGFVVGATEPEYQDRMRARAKKMGADADELLADPPEPWIAGTLDQATEQLAALSDAGVSRVMCQHYVHDDLEAVALLGSELAPRVS